MESRKQSSKTSNNLQFYNTGPCLYGKDTDIKVELMILTVNNTGHEIYNTKGKVWQCSRDLQFSKRLNFTAAVSP
ncbi:hypothetical protein ABVT39_024614 [Epinephelus coioides]